MKIQRLVRSLVLAAFALIVGACSSGPRDESVLDIISIHDGSDAAGNNSETEGNGEGGNGGGAGGSTSSGNPPLMTFKSVTALALLEPGMRLEGSNLVGLVDNEVRDVIIPSADVMPPPVEEMFTGPDGSIVLLFASEISTANGSCRFVHVTRDDGVATCIDGSVAELATLETTHRSIGIPGGHQAVQFAGDGSLFFASGDWITRWSVDDGVAMLPNDGSLTFSDYTLAASNVVISGSSDTETFFGLVALDRVFESAVTNDVRHFDAVADDEILMAVSVDDAQPETLTRLTLATMESTPLNVETIPAKHYFDFQKGRDGEVYALAAQSDDLDGPRLIAQLLPGEPRGIYQSEMNIRYFSANDAFLYIVAEDSMERESLYRVDPSAPEVWEDLLPGWNLRVDRFLVVGETVYVDGYVFESPIVAKKTHVLTRIADDEQKTAEVLLKNTSPLLRLEILVNSE